LLINLVRVDDRSIDYVEFLAATARGSIQIVNDREGEREREDEGE